MSDKEIEIRQADGTTDQLMDRQTNKERETDRLSDRLEYRQTVQKKY